MVPRFPTKNTFGLPNSNNRKQKRRRRREAVFSKNEIVLFLKKINKFGFPPKKHFCVEMQLKVWTENGEFMFNYINWKNYLFNQTLPP